MKTPGKKDINQFKAMQYQEDAKERVNRHIPISIFFFSIVLIYGIFIIYHSLSTKSIKAVTVEAGSLTESDIFNAMVLRRETNVYAAESGIVDTFLPAGTTAKKGEAVCSVTRDAAKREQILANLSAEKARMTSAIEYDTQTEKELQAFLREYAVNINYRQLAYTAQAMLELENMLNSGSFAYTIQDNGSYQKSVDNLDLYRQQIASIGKVYTVPQSSTISYYTDGLEEITAQDFQLSDLKKQEQPMHRLEKKEVTANDFLFKAIDNLYYYFGVEVNAAAYSYLEDMSGDYITLFFPSKNLSMTAHLERLEPYTDGYLAVFQADRFINRFLEDRFVPVQITYDQHSGLKVPNSAITAKQVLVIPKTAVNKNERGDYFVRKRTINEKKQETGVFVRVKVYGEDEENHYYVLAVDDPRELAKEDVIFTSDLPTSDEYERYTISQEEKILGVYVLNKGYADFKRIRRLYQSDHFSIVQKFFPYSIKIYDQIAGEAQGIKEFSIVK